jgi:hypothetical protein
MIDYLVHVYKRGTEPFRSLLGLSDSEALGIMRDLYIEGSVFWERFKDPAHYLQLRKQVEEWLRREFIVKGGKPQAPYPMYSVFGTSKWIETRLDATTLATTVQLQIPLSAFGEDDVSFTFPDSMVSFLLNQERNPEYYQPEYHGQVFTLCEIRSIVEANGLPGYRWGTNLPDHLANYIEAQIWNHEPLETYRSGRGVE